MAVSASRTVSLVASELEGKSIDMELPEITVQSIAATTDSWPIQVAVTVHIAGPLETKLWIAEFDNSGLQQASEQEIALSISTNIRVLIRELVATGNTHDLQDL